MLPMLNVVNPLSLHFGQTCIHMQECVRCLLVKCSQAYVTRYAKNRAYIKLTPEFITIAFISLESLMLIVHCLAEIQLFYADPLKVFTEKTMS